MDGEGREMKNHGGVIDKRRAGEGNHAPSTLQTVGSSALTRSHKMGRPVLVCLLFVFLTPTLPLGSARTLSAFPSLLAKLGEVRDETANSIFDRLFANLRQTFPELGLDPLPLPDDEDDFSVNLFNVTLPGHVGVALGPLRGLSSIHRAGDMSLEYVGDQSEVVWGGELGLIDLEVAAHLELEAPVLGGNLDLDAKLSFLHLSFETNVFLDSGLMQFTRCNVTEMGPVHYRERGAGPLDTPLFNMLVNFLLEKAPEILRRALESLVCSVVQNALTNTV